VRPKQPLKLLTSTKQTSGWGYQIERRSLLRLLEVRLMPQAYSIVATRVTAHSAPYDIACCNHTLCSTRPICWSITIWREIYWWCYSSISRICMVIWIVMVMWRSSRDSSYQYGNCEWVDCLRWLRERNRCYRQSNYWAQSFCLTNVLHFLPSNFRDTNRRKHK